MRTLCVVKSGCGWRCLEKTGGSGTALLDLKSAQSLRWEKRGKADTDGDVWKKTGALGTAPLVLKCAQPLRCQKQLFMLMFRKKGGFWDRAVGSVNARRLSVGESGCGRCCWGREKQRLCGFGAAFVLVWTLHCEKQMSMTQCVT